MWTSFRQIVDAWPTAADFGRDIGLSDISGRSMRRRDYIDGRYWLRVVEAAEQRGIKGVTLHCLATLAAAPARRRAA